jgi:outer membrane murein-binding lipoprotein Lpp
VEKLYIGNNMSVAIVEERVTDLEKAFIRLETTTTVLVDKMSDVASSMQTMSHAVSQLATVSAKVDRLDKDIHAVATEQRNLSARVSTNYATVNDKIATLHEDTTRKCTDEHKEVDKNGIARLIFGLGIASTMIGIAFGYLYIDVKEVVNEQRVVESKVSDNRKDVAVIINKLDNIQFSLKKIME